jgi:hypothetical protein
LLVALPMMLGYGAVGATAHGICGRIGSPDGTADVALGLLVGVNLLCRLQPAAGLDRISARTRVNASMLGMVGALLSLVIAYFAASATTPAFLMISAIVAGGAAANFEAAFLSAITPFGHAYKCWAIIGIPIGHHIGRDGVAAGLLMVPATHHAALYRGVLLATAALCVVGLCIFRVLLRPDLSTARDDCEPSTNTAAADDVEGEALADFAAQRRTVAAAVHDARAWRAWLPLVALNCGVYAADSVVCGAFYRLGLYVHTAEAVPLVPHGSATMSAAVFGVVYHLAANVGDVLTRRVSYHFRQRRPHVFLPLQVVGAALLLSKVAVLAPAGVGLVMACNGLTFAHTMRRVDNAVGGRYHLAAVSAFLVAGGVGHLIGSELAPLLQDAVGRA